MTQALNLALFANNLNTSGATNNTGLQNSAVTVTAGTGMSGGGSVALGSAVTLNNAGVTSLTAGTGIAVSASTGGVTISSTAINSITTVGALTASVASGVATLTTAVRAWANFNGSGGTIRASFNVASITQNATGDYTINFTTPMPDANYSISMVSDTNITQLAAGVAPTTTGFRIWTTTTNAYIDTAYVFIQVFR
jgi:hypothetical protein